MKKGPKHYQQLVEQFPKVLEAVENLGSAIRAAGPLDAKTAELIGLAVAASNQSTGAVHSHARRALAAGDRDRHPRGLPHTRNTCRAG